MNALLHSKNADPYFTANEFATFFHNKVKTTCDSTVGAEHPSVISPTDSRMPAFTPCSYYLRHQSAAWTLPKQAVSSWSCANLQWLVKSRSNIFIPILTKIVNASLVSSQFSNAHMLSSLLYWRNLPCRSCTVKQLQTYLTCRLYLSSLNARSPARFHRTSVPTTYHCSQPTDQGTTGTALLKIINDAL